MTKNAIKTASVLATALVFFVAAACFLAAAPGAQASDEEALFEPGHVQTVQVGDIRVLSIVDCPTSFSTELLNPEVRGSLAPQATFKGVIKTYLVDMGKDKILVDTGFGRNGKTPGKTVEALAANGIRPEDITHILLTHLDSDHCGGLGYDKKPTFPNAVVHVSQAEYDAWMAGKVRRGARNIDLARELLGLYEVETFSFGSYPVPGILALDAHGHTPGHVVYELASKDKRFCIAGDLLHILAVQMRFPRACTAYDMDEAAAIDSRLAILKRLSEHKIQTGAMHFPEIGQVHLDASGNFSLQKR